MAVVIELTQISRKKICQKVLWISEPSLPEEEPGGSISNTNWISPQSKQKEKDHRNKKILNIIWLTPPVDHGRQDDDEGQRHELPAVQLKSEQVWDGPFKVEL